MLTLSNQSHLLPERWDPSSDADDEEEDRDNYTVVTFECEGGGTNDRFQKIKNSNKNRKKSKNSKAGSDDEQQDQDAFAQKFMPEGTPGRKSFVAIPRQRKHFWRQEALHLRKIFPFTGLVHLCFIFSDIFVYGDLLIILADSILLWLDFYNFMMLNKVCIMIEMAI